jgi:hypothetical protein
MPIERLLAQAAFDPETIDILAAAFEVAWENLQASGGPLTNDTAASTRELLAKRIIDMGSRGERDPLKLMNDALAHLAENFETPKDEPI